MPTEKFANNSQGTINLAMDAFVGFCQVASGSVFPFQPQFRILVDDEIMLVTGVAGNVFSVQRGAEGTLSAPHQSGSACLHVLTAGAIGKLTQDFAGPTGALGPVGPPGPTGSIGPVGPAAIISPIDISITSGLFKVMYPTYERIGGRKIDINLYPGNIGLLTRNVVFVADLDISGGATSAEVLLVNVTDAENVTGANLMSFSFLNDEQSSVALTVGISSGDIRDDHAAQYEVHLRMNGGTPGVDSVFCTNARLVITYI